MNYNELSECILNKLNSHKNILLIGDSQGFLSKEILNKNIDFLYLLDNWSIFGNKKFLDNQDTRIYLNDAILWECLSRTEVQLKQFNNKTIVNQPNTLNSDFLKNNSLDCVILNLISSEQDFNQYIYSYSSKLKIGGYFCGSFYMGYEGNRAIDYNISLYASMFAEKYGLKCEIDPSYSWFIQKTKEIEFR